MFEVLHQNYHLQGFTTDGAHLYWSFTDSLVKTNLQNTVVAQVPVQCGHMGDIDYYDGKLYASLMGNAIAGDPWDKWSSFFIYVYDADTLALERMIRLDPCYRMQAAPAEHHGFIGIDGVAVRRSKDGTPQLWVAAVLMKDAAYDKQMLLHFSMDGELLEIKYFTTGNTTFGIQNLDYEEDTGLFWFSMYSKNQPYQSDFTLCAGDINTEQVVSGYSLRTPYGFHAEGNGHYLVSTESGTNGNRQGYAHRITQEELESRATSD